MTGRKALSSISREAPILIAGPTGSGKSALAMELAARDGRIIVNADALQVYDCWRILTARPSVAAEAQIPHALYGHVGREISYSAGHWLREIGEWLQQPVVIVGGTGLYFTALTVGLSDIPPIPDEIRQQANGLRHADFNAMVASLDPATAARTDLRNPARVQRGWEVLQATGRGLVEWQRESSRPMLPLSKTEALVVTMERAVLYQRINQRFEAMMASGAMDEVRAELPFWRPDRPSSQAIGARQLIACLQGKITLQDAIESARQESRRYAKRQCSWIRSRMKEWRVFPVT